MNRPDFAYKNVSRLTDPDIRFLVESFPEPGKTYEDIVRVLGSLPTTLESMLTNRSVVERVIHDRDQLLQISPFLLFNVLLRQTLHDPEDAVDRGVTNYLANLLALFVRAHRLHRIEGDDEHGFAYLVDLLEQANGADSRRRFLVHAHVGNYSLYLTGLFGEWVEGRFRHGRRLVDTSYYADLGSASFSQASALPLAQEYGLAAVFLRLSLMFEPYRDALARLAREYLRQG